MTGAMAATARPPSGLPAELIKSLVPLWTQYAGTAPSRARTEIRGNVVTRVLVDAVGNIVQPRSPLTRRQATAED